MDPRNFPRQAPGSRFPVPMQVRVRYSVLLQLAEHGTADRATTVAICPGTDRRDLETALQSLHDEKSIVGPTWRLSSMVALAEAGRLNLTDRGRQRLAADDI